VKDVAKELADFFTKHAKEMDAGFDEEDGDYPSGPTEVATAFAKKHGFTWKSAMYWGDEMQTGDEPEVYTEGDALLLYHGYCGGGLPKEVEQYIAIKGGTIGKAPKDFYDAVYVSVLARLPKAGVKSPLKKDLDAFYSVMNEEGEGMSGNPPPWSGEDEAYGKASYFCDGKSVGFFSPSSPRDLEAIKKWLKKRGAVDPILRINEWADHRKFQAIADARCTECDGLLEYLDPRVTKIESDQLACAKCGGMFDLTTFMGKKKKKKKPVPAPAVAEPAAKKTASTTTTKKKKKKTAAKAKKKTKKAAAKKPK
jgi:hypothetical protein